MKTEFGVIRDLCEEHDLLHIWAELYRRYVVIKRCLVWNTISFHGAFGDSESALASRNVPGNDYLVLDLYGTESTAFDWYRIDLPVADPATMEQEVLSYIFEPPPAPVPASAPAPTPPGAFQQVHDQWAVFNGWNQTRREFATKYGREMTSDEQHTFAPVEVRNAMREDRRVVRQWMEENKDGYLSECGEEAAEYLAEDAPGETGCRLGHEELIRIANEVMGVK